MNAAVDIGNSMVKIGLFDQNDLIQTHETNENGLSDFLARNPIQLIIVSAVKQIDLETIAAIQQNCDEVLVMNTSTPLSITVNYKSPETLGVDRIAAVVGSLKYSQSNPQIIDIGTCITYDLLNRNRVLKES